MAFPRPPAVRQLTEEAIRNSENKTTNYVRGVFTLLERQGRPVHYYRFVVNPRSFSETIENMFWVAFLVQEGRAELSINAADGQPYLRTFA